MPRRLGRTTLALDAASLAPRLLGQSLVRILSDGTRLAGRIVETEAYVGFGDRACHSFGGRRTPRNEAMYARAGTAYVYFTYGMHWCFNVVCGRVDEPVAVLIRAIEPTEGLGRMRALRRAASGRAVVDRDLARGPARLCQALAIDGELNGIDLASDDRLFLQSSRRVQPHAFHASPRIGVDRAGEWARAPLRFYLAGSRFVSRHQRGRPMD
jgi:DNA-3-methyladenine glycosylase